MTAKEFHKNVMEKFTNSITDKVFLMIQNDHDLMEAYLNLLDGNKRKNINSEIAKAIKDNYGLQNNGECKKPNSTLIKSYMTFKK
jgi:hypothetical protein